jgi:PKD domain-containing protein
MPGVLFLNCIKENAMSHNIFRWFVSLMLALALLTITSAPQQVYAAGSWYVTPAGDDSNDCLSPGNACGTINGAIAKASAGDAINVAIGIYTGTGSEVVLIDRDVTLSGGWDLSFTTQSGFSSIDGQKSMRGVMVNSGVTASLEHFIIKNGFILDYGGGIYSNGNLTLSKSSIHSNSIGNYSYGGGIFFNGDVLTINNTTVSNNSAGGNGGGVFSSSSSSTVTINNSTISNNKGGGVFNNGTFNLKNTIISGNTVEDCNGTPFNSQGNNIIGSTTSCNITASSGDQFNVDPLLGTFLSTQGYYPLLPSSPAIDAGDNAICPATDQRGVIRPQGAACDIGAYEFTTPGAAANAVIVAGDSQRTPPNAAYPIPFSLIVLDSQGTPVDGVTVTFTAPSTDASGTFANTSTNTTSANTDSSGFAIAPAFTANNIFGAYTVSASGVGFGSVDFSLENAGWYVEATGNDTNSCSQPASPCATISGAFNQPTFLPGDTILVAEEADTSPLIISKSLNLSGGWESTFTSRTGFSTIDGQNAQRGMLVMHGVTVILDRFIIKNGFILDYGGGIFNDGTLTLNNSSIHSNSIGNYCYGGGIFNQFGNTLTLNNTTVSNNSAGCNGGGVFDASGILNLNNSTISNNSGGGIYLNGVINLRNTIISGNALEDCNGVPFTSQGNNIISNTVNCPVTAGPGDQFDVDPLLGTFLPTRGYYPLLPGSPAIDNGDNATCLDVDQRGLARPQGAACDIGAYEFATPGSAVSLSVVGGNNQTATTNSTFLKALQVAALDNVGSPVSAVSIAFSAPASGASGTFANTHTNTTSVNTDEGGVATTSTFTANSQAGTYTVSASAVGLGSVSFNLEQVVGPVNDNFSNATVITELPFDDTIDTVAASMELSEPRPSCVSNDITGSIWYTFTPSTSGSVSASAFNPPFDTLVAAYTGSSLANLSEIGCQTFMFNLVTFHVDAGTTYYFQVGTIQSGQGGPTQFHIEVTPPPVAGFYFNPNPPSIFDTVEFCDNSSDPGQVGFESFAWNFGDGTTGTTNCSTHQYAKDGDYTVQYTVTTFDGRSASTSQVVQVSTHDVSITKVIAPKSANSGQTKAITVAIRNTRYPETVTVDLYKSTPGGDVWISSLTLQIPKLSGNKTKLFTFNYMFTSQDAQIGKVTFRAVATINGANDAFPQDNIAISSPPTKVGR